MCSLLFLQTAKIYIEQPAAFVTSVGAASMSNVLIIPAEQTKEVSQNLQSVNILNF